MNSPLALEYILRICADRALLPKDYYDEIEEGIELTEKATELVLLARAVAIEFDVDVIQVIRVMVRTKENMRGGHLVYNDVMV
jgi:hypothetical protein